MGAEQKAIIFTESRRTQNYLLRVLADSPFKDGIVLFNGTNTDDRSKQIYAAWLARHQGTDRVTGSKTADMRSALVDYFREEGRIMIATEAGAEGINLQFCSLVVNYDPLGYTQPVGEHLKYMVYTCGRPLACLAWSSAPRHLGARDRFIGWSAEARRRNLRFLAYNPRYLIVPYVQVKHLASHILGEMARRISSDWERTSGHPIYFLETFVDPERHRGTCYRAANWVGMGRTTGRGKNCPNKRPNRSIKEVLGYPLTPRFRELLAKVE